LTPTSPQCCTETYTILNEGKKKTIMCNRRSSMMYAGLHGYETTCECKDVA
jgi:hypothetical protein